VQYAYRLRPRNYSLSLVLYGVGSFNVSVGIFSVDVISCLCFED
jgi:uncharacterized membrane protein YuzA (DUF378 family)